MRKITDTARKILEERYFLYGETEWEHLADRVAFSFALDDEEKILFSKALRNMDWLPNSPTLMNAGTTTHSYSACFVLPIEDSIDSIFKYYSDAAIISKSGGGVGASFSKIRPKGEAVNTTSGVASGPISFMEGQDALTEVIKQGGRRKGANMMMLDVDHDDIEDFIVAKHTPGVLENANISVSLSNGFMMEATKNADSRDAKVLDMIAESAWKSAEPGVFFIDTVNAENEIPHLGTIEASNPCGEQPLLPYESCSLISINLYSHLDKDTNKFDWVKLDKSVRSAVLFMNRVLDHSEFPIPECVEAMENTRKIGVGIMGLHDVLINLGLPYDSIEGRRMAADIMSSIQYNAITMSEELAGKEGAYNGWSMDLSHHPARRNACLTTIAPTGTLSMIANVSSGCEPYYSPITYKTVLDGNTFCMPNKNLPESVKQEILNGNTDLKSLLTQEEYFLFKPASEIHWEDHIKMQAVLQPYIDSAISKTINMPSTCTKEDVKAAYEMAWKLGCKGITVYRDGSRSEQVLSDTDTVTEHNEDVEVDEFPVPFKLVLSDELKAVRYRIRDIDGNKVYFTVCTQGGKPVEVFARLPEEVSDSSWHTISRLVSLALRYNIPLDDVCKQLRKSSSSISDTPSRLARVLDNYRSPEDNVVEEREEPMVLSGGMLCPDCGSKLTPGGGCVYCEACGWSKCG